IKLPEPPLASRDASLVAPRDRFTWYTSTLSGEMKSTPWCSVQRKLMVRSKAWSPYFSVMLIFQAGTGACATTQTGQHKQNNTNIFIQNFIGASCRLDRCVPRHSGLPDPQTGLPESGG